MKKILMVLAVAGFAVACNNAAETKEEVTPAPVEETTPAPVEEAPAQDTTATAAPATEAAPATN